MNKEITFGYAISTVESRLLENVDFIAQIAKINDPVVIVNQFQRQSLEASLFGKHVQVINSESRGLSQSRNIALNAIDADFVMICDDDISLVLENIARVKEEIQRDPETALFFTQLKKTTGELWRRNYEPKAFTIDNVSFNTLRRIQRINSMEQVYNRRFLNDKNLVFDNHFGAGSEGFQLGEETLMTWSILKSGGTLRYLPFVTRVHPPLSSGSVLSLESARAVLAVQWKIFGLIGLLTFSGFILKSLLRSITSRTQLRPPSFRH